MTWSPNKPLFRFFPKIKARQSPLSAEALGLPFLTPSVYPNGVFYLFLTPSVYPNGVFYMQLRQIQGVGLSRISASKAVTIHSEP
jgi:hypothetical protein